MFFTPEHTGWSKTQVARTFLAGINPDVRFRAFNYDITTRFEDFVSALRRGNADESGPVNLVVCCVDNRTARLIVNEACHEINLPWICASVDSTTSLSGQIRYIKPGQNACMQCTETVETQRDDDVHANLPSSNSVIAGFTATTCLK